jgi:hypothetical protein
MVMGPRTVAWARCSWVRHPLRCIWSNGLKPFAHGAACAAPPRTLYITTGLSEALPTRALVLLLACVTIRRRTSCDISRSAFRATGTGIEDPASYVKQKTTVNLSARSRRG